MGGAASLAELLDVVERLQSIVGAASLRRVAARPGKLLDHRHSQPVHHSRRRAPAPARNAGEFPLDDSEFRAALKFDIAAARIAAISSPEIPCGIRVTINVG